MDQRIIDLYDRFTHGHLSRRVFLDRLAEVAGSTAAATSFLSLLANDYAGAAIVDPNDPRLATDTVAYPVSGVTMSGQLIRLKDKVKRPAVVVIHENRGFNAHIRDVARRIALEGFLAYAIDALAPYGGTPATDDQGREMFSANIKIDETAPRIAAAIPFLKAHAESTGKAGAVGFCWGGGAVNRIAILSPDLDAGVAYYGPVPPLDQVARIRAPLLLHYAALDNFVNGKVPDYEAALKAAGKKYTAHMYPNAHHSFNNDTSGPRYSKEAADLAWDRTIAFFKENLGTPPKAS